MRGAEDRGGRRFARNKGFGAIAAVLALIAALSSAASRTALAAELDGVQLPDTTTVAGHLLQLNGLGSRSRFGITVYVAGLYVPTRSTEAAVLIAQPGPKRIAFVVRYPVSGEAFANALTDGIKANSPEAHRAVLQDRMDRFAETVRSTRQIREGDRMAIDVTPGEGTLLVVNDRMVGEAVPGDDFGRAVLGIFLGEKPAQESLKNGLLGTGH